MISATGPAYMIPSIPIKNGNMRMSGKRKMICLVNERKIPCVALPIDVKKFEVIGCKQLIKVPSKNIRK